MINVGFIGAGEIADTHAAAIDLVASARLAAVTDLDLSRAKALAARHGATVAEDVATLLRASGLDVVYILTPPAAHMEQIMAVAEAGIPIMCEKPLTVTLAEAERAIGYARERQVPVMTGLTHRYHPLAAEVRSMIQAGEFGDFVAAWSHRLIHLPVRPNSWLNDLSAAGGLTLQYAMHDLDWAMSVGGNVVEVTAQQYRADEALNIEDNLWALLRFDNGGSGSLGASWSAAQAHAERGVVGTRGNLRIVEQKHLIGAFHDGRVVNRHLGDDYDWFDVFVRESQDVIDCVRRGDTFTITGEDGRRALELSVATLHAAQQVRPVSLPLPATFSMEELP